MKKWRDNMEEELKQLKAENIELKEKLETYIPRRRVRRVYKMLKNILEADLVNENKQYINTLISFIVKIEKEGPQKADQEIKTAIEHLLSIIDLKEEVG